MTYGWGHQHRVYLTAHVLKKSELLMSEWLTAPTSDAAPRPKLDAFERWAGMRAVIDGTVSAWVNGTLPVPSHLQLFTLASTVRTSRASATASATSTTTSSTATPNEKKLQEQMDALTKMFKDGLKQIKTEAKQRKQKDRRNGKDDGGGDSDPDDTRRAAKSTRRGTSDKTSPGSGDGAGEEAQSVSGRLRSQKTFTKALGDAKCREAIDRFPALGRDKDTATCRSWLACAKCKQSVTNRRCAYGAHYVTSDTDSDAAAFVRAMAAAEGRDGSSFKGFGDADYGP